LLCQCPRWHLKSVEHEFREINRMRKQPVLPSVSYFVAELYWQNAVHDVSESDRAANKH
jgi:hypothetical protein